MSTHKELLGRLRSTNPVPHPDQTNPDELDVVFSLLTERRAVMASASTKELDRSHRKLEPPRHPRRRLALAFAGAAVAVAAAVGIATNLLQGDESEPAAPPATPAPVPTVTEPTVSSAPTTTVPAAPPETTPLTTVAMGGADEPIFPDPPAPTVSPALGEGWEMILTNVPADDRFLESDLVFPTFAGQYVRYTEEGWSLVSNPRGDPATVDIDVPAAPGGFVEGGPGIVAWFNTGPESRGEGQIWVSADGRTFERVAPGLLTGCDGATGCLGTRILTATSSADRVVALAYDPLILNESGECCILNPVALVSEDGYEWSRYPIDLLEVLPESWQGAANIENPLLHVAGRWLTYGEQFSDSCQCVLTAFYGSDDGATWYPIESTGIPDGHLLAGIAANDTGVVTVSVDSDFTLAVFRSDDGSIWERSSPSPDPVGNLDVAAYDDGFVIVTGPFSFEGASSLDTIWYSSDGLRWSDQRLQLEEPTEWNDIVGADSGVVAIGGTYTNLRGVWLWMPPE